jgi:hypothetical protein
LCITHLGSTLGKYKVITIRPRFASLLLFVALPSLSKGQAPLPDTNSPVVQRVHSHLFSGQQVQKIPQMLAASSGDLLVHVNQSPGMWTDTNSIPPYPPHSLLFFACRADAIVVATAETGPPHLTSDESFVYTDWRVSVEQVLKGAIRPGSRLLVARPGGKLVMNGRNVFASDINFRPFTSGQRYLLFLTFIPETGGYKAESEKSFQLANGMGLLLVRHNRFPELENKNENSFLTDSAAAVAAASNSPGCLK